MIANMKRRKLRHYIEAINAILTDPRKHDGQARSETLLLLRKIIPIGPTATAAAKNAINNPASLAGSAQPRRRSTRSQFRDGVTVGVGVRQYALTADAYRKIVAHLSGGEYIQAVKEMRLATGCGLKDAKDIVDGDPKLAAVQQERRRRMTART